MDAPAILIVIFTVMAVAVLAASLAQGGHPENGCGHGDAANTSTSAEFYFLPDRPAGPDAEDASFERGPPAPRSAGAGPRWHQRRRNITRARAGG